MDEEVKIWQRVRGNQPLATDGLPALAAGALSRAALYGSLARQMQGPVRSILVQLQEEEQHCAGCIKGICRMITGKPMHVTHVPPSFERIDTALRKCYGQTLKAYAAYAERSRDGEYGAVFSHLAAQAQTHCCKLAELLGF